MHTQTDEWIDPIGGDAAAVSAYKKLQAASSIRWSHWVAVLLSLLLTFFAWYYSNSFLEARIASRFDREAEQVVELILERMRKYEDALWSGVALVESSSGDVDFRFWRNYASRMDIKHKYPGVNGIGIVHAISREEVPQYLAEQRKSRPDFHIFPAHEEQDVMPINCITPTTGNEGSIGLDMAHEANRYRAAQKSRDTNSAQITGPITLVQDSDSTPGFLFYAPFYKGGAHAEVSERRKHFAGLVHAPFVVKKLMQGVLEKEKRHVGIRLVDGSKILYDEHVASEPDFDAHPLFQRAVDVELYGRTWTFDIWSTKSFRVASQGNLPWIILAGGILIDALIILLFISISRASAKALGYANSMTHQLKVTTAELKANQIRLAERAEELEQSNAELEQFAYMASHDLREPLRKVTSFCQLLQREYGDKLGKDGEMYIDYAVDGAKRMKHLITDLLSYSRLKTECKKLEIADASIACAGAVANLDTAIQEANAQVVVGALPLVAADSSQLVSLFQNLIGNAVKYRSAERTPEVHVWVEDVAGEHVFCVEDNGIGIEPQYTDKIFEIFRRLHAKNEYSGTGIGLAICKRIVDRCGGRIWVESVPGQGSKFFFALPQVQPAFHSGMLQDEFSKKTA